MQKVTKCLIVFTRNYCVFASQGFVTKCFLTFIIDEVKNFVTKCFFIFIVDEVKNFAANNIFFKLLELVMYWDLCIISGVYILESSEVLKR